MIECYFVETANKLSDSQEYGDLYKRVSQGSILKLLLFLCYVIDMPQAVKSNFFLYVDDSCLIYQHKYIAEIGKKT